MKSIRFKKQIVSCICLLFMVGIFCICIPLEAFATEVPQAPQIQESSTAPDATTEGADAGNTLQITYNDGNGQVNGALRILILITLIAFAPAMLIMVTSFTRIIIVMHFTRSALGTQSAPPNQVLIGISVFLTFFIMAPVFTQINEEAIKPFDKGEITQEVALERAVEPVGEFMYAQTQSKDVSVFMEISGQEWDGTPEGVPTSVLIPSFILSELRTAFIIGFLIYIPFIVIDMVVSSVLMSMGMMMLPPTTISMPFKILLFVLADGWNLVIVNLVKTFY